MEGGRRRFYGPFGGFVTAGTGVGRGESGVGRAHNIALSTLPNFRLPGDVSASKRYWKEDIIDPEVRVSAQGTIAISDAVGTGYRVREDLVERLTVRKETIRAGAQKA